jgi:hypothetical protein
MGCDARTHVEPTDLTEGVSAFHGGPNLFLWEFAANISGTHSCLVHDFLGGLKHMETPCASVALDGAKVELEMPNGVRYEGQVDLGRRRIEGSLLYVDGTSLEAPLHWAPLADYPGLQPRSEKAGPCVYVPAVDLDDGWRVAHAAERGVEPEALEGLMEAVIRGEVSSSSSSLSWIWRW